MSLTQQEKLDLFAEFFILIGVDPEDPRIDVGNPEKFYSIGGKRFRLMIVDSDVLLVDSKKAVWALPVVPKRRVITDEDSCDITPLDETISYKRSDSVGLSLAAPSTFIPGQVVEIFNLTDGAIQLTGPMDAFLDDGVSASMLVLGAFKSIRLSVQDLPGEGNVFMIA